jgi:hypothetical protein
MERLKEPKSKAVMALAELARSYEKGGKEALEAKFRELYPDKVDSSTKKPTADPDPEPGKTKIAS